jgi:hypothetical protein
VSHNPLSFPLGTVTDGSIFLVQRLSLAMSHCPCSMYNFSLLLLPHPFPFSPSSALAHMAHIVLCLPLHLAISPSTWRIARDRLALTLPPSPMGGVVAFSLAAANTDYPPDYKFACASHRSALPSGMPALSPSRHRKSRPYLLHRPRCPLTISLTHPL